MTPWPAERLDDRFRAIDDALKDTQYHLRAFAPVVGQVAVVEGGLAEARAELRDLRAEYRSERDAHRRELQEERANSRKEQIALIATVVGFFSAVAGGTVLAVLTGIVGS